MKLSGGEILGAPPPSSPHSSEIPCTRHDADGTKRPQLVIPLGSYHLVDVFMISLGNGGMEAISVGGPGRIEKGWDVESFVLLCALPHSSASNSVFGCAWDGMSTPGRQ